MDQATHEKIVSFIWGIANDVLRHLVDLYWRTRQFVEAWRERPKLSPAVREIHSAAAASTGKNSNVVESEYQHGSC